MLGIGERGNCLHNQGREKNTQRGSLNFGWDPPGKFKPKQKKALRDPNWRKNKGGNSLKRG